MIVAPRAIILVGLLIAAAFAGTGAAAAPAANAHVAPPFAPKVIAAASPAPKMTAAPTPDAVPTLSPMQLLAVIRNTFRKHRPPPPYITYTEARKQNTDRGFFDYADSYAYKYWCRTLDRACLKRKVLIVPAMGYAEFERAAFNEDRDPGPPTADLFEKAPEHSVPQSVVPTPEPTQQQLKVIGEVRVVNEFEYAVDSVTTEGNLVHLVLRPLRDPERNRLRELWANKDTYELVRVKAHDRLFVETGARGADIYGVIFDIKIAMLQGTPVVTDIHGVVGDNYTGDGQIVDFTYRDIAFPADEPAWYFDPKKYGGHPEADLPK